jgi:hypothetical protein
MRYRFFCEDHHKKVNSTGHSEWFLSKRRLQRIVGQDGGLNEQTKQFAEFIKVNDDDEEIEPSK